MGKPRQVIPYCMDDGFSVPEWEREGATELRRDSIFDDPDAAGYVPTKEELLERKVGDCLQRIRKAGKAVYEQVLNQLQNDKGAMPKKFCTACGTEIDPDHELSRIERANIRRCTDCEGVRQKNLEVKYCHSCGKPWTLKQYLKHSWRATSAEECWGSPLKGWGTWSAHPKCRERLKKRSAKLLKKHRKQARAARDKEFEKLVKAIKDSEVRTVVAKRLRVKSAI